MFVLFKLLRNDDVGLLSYQTNGHTGKQEVILV